MGPQLHVRPSVWAGETESCLYIEATGKETCDSSGLQTPSSCRRENDTHRLVTKDTYFVL